MTLQPMVPVSLLAVVVLALLALCVTLAVVRRHRRPDLLAWSRRGAIVLVVGVIGLGPSLPHDEVATVTSNVEVYFVVDRTGSMSATDYDGGKARLAGVIADITAIANALPGARYSVIGFDSTATRQLPLTTDVRAVRSWAQTLHTELTSYSTGSLIDRPLDALVDALDSSRTSFPDDERYVFFLSDGENTADGTPASYAPVAPLIDGGAVLGYGTAKGATMTTYDPSSPDDGAPILDYSQPGAPEAISTIDEEQLKTVASQMGVPYAHRTGAKDDETVDQLVSGIDLSQIAQVGRRTVTVYQYVVWPGALLLALLVVWELTGAVRRTARPVAGVSARG